MSEEAQASRMMMAQEMNRQALEVLTEIGVGCGERIDSVEEGKGHRECTGSLRLIHPGDGYRVNTTKDLYVVRAACPRCGNAQEVYYNREGACRLSEAALAEIAAFREGIDKGADVEEPHPQPMVVPGEQLTKKPSTKLDI